MAKRAKKMTAKASACVSHQIKKHCKRKRRKGMGNCKSANVRAQAVAIAFSQCKRKGFRSIPRKP